MGKKNGKQKAFETYQNKYIGRLFKEELKPLLEKYKGEINAFRNEWLLTSRIIRTEKEYQEWLEIIEKKLGYKKTKVAYFEEEEGHTLKGYDTVAIELFTLMEESPRITPQGDSLEAVFDYRFRQLMRKLGIDPDWYGLFLNYIFTGKINLKLIGHPNIEITERFLFGPENDEIDHRISLNVGPNTRIEEVKKAWRYIVKPLQGKMKALWKGKERKKPTHEVGIKALKLRQKGKTYKQILDELDPHSERFDEFSIRKAMMRAKQRLEK